MDCNSFLQNNSSFIKFIKSQFQKVVSAEVLEGTESFHLQLETGASGLSHTKECPLILAPYKKRTFPFRFREAEVFLISSCLILLLF